MQNNTCVNYFYQLGNHLMKNYLLSLLSFCMLIVSTNVYAAEVTDQGATKIQTNLQTLIDNRIALFNAQAKFKDKTVGLQTEGSVSVTPSGSYYAATLPYIFFRTEDNERFNVGQITANILPITETTWKVAMALPSPMTGVNSKGTTELELHIGNQKFSGLWDTELEIYPKLKLVYNDITLNLLKGNKEGKFDFKIGNIKTDMMLDKNPDGTYTGPTDFSMNDLKIAVIAKGTNSNINIGQISGTSIYKDLNMTGAIKLRKELETMMENPDFKDQDLINMLSSSFSFYKDMASGIDSNFNMNDLNVTWADKEQKNSSISIGNVHSVFDINGMKGDGAKVHARTTLSGLSLTGDANSGQFKDLIPSDTSFDMLIENLPYQSMLDATMDIAKSVQENDTDAENTAPNKQQIMAGMMTMPQKLIDAGTKLTISDTFIKSPDLHTGFFGTVSGSATSPMKAVADFTLTITGLDELVAKLDAMSKAGTLPSRGQGMISVLSMVHMMGQIGTGDAGKPARTYNFKLTDQGKAHMNGQDMGPMIGMAMGGAMGGGQQSMQAVSEPAQ